MGFLFGPAIGGGLTYWAEHISEDTFFRTSFSSYWVSALCLITFLFALKYLKETHKVSSNALPVHEGRFARLFKYFKIETVGPLMFVFFLSSLAMSTMEATLILFARDKFGWGLKEVSFGFAYIGVIIVITQGFLVRRLLPLVGEKKLLRTGLVFMTIGFSGVALAESIAFLAITQTFLAVGMGFTNPSILGSVSLLTSSDEQGAALGTTQGLSSLGRIIGPAVGGALYAALTMQSPFIFSTAAIMIALFIVITIYADIPNTGKRAKSVVTDDKTAEKTAKNSEAGKAQGETKK